MSKRVHLLLTVLLVAVLALSACGGGRTQEAEEVQEAAPLAQEEAAPTEAPAEEEVVAEEEAPAEEAVEEEAAEEEAPAEEEAADEDAAADPVVAAFDAYLSTIPEGWMSVGDAEKMQEAIDNGAFVIDVRQPSEYEEGHIPGAINIPLRELAQNLDKVPSDQQVITYCASGHRAGMGLSALRGLGYDNA